MSSTTRPSRSRRPGIYGALLTVCLGLMFLVGPLGVTFSNWSYDFQYLFRPTTAPDQVVVVYMDSESHDQLGPIEGSIWHRLLHAELIKALDRLGARAIVFDVSITKSWGELNPPMTRTTEQTLTRRFQYNTNQLTGDQVDLLLAQNAINASCPVVFGGELRVIERGVHIQMLYPDKVLGTNILFGRTDFPLQDDTIIRRHNDDGPPTVPSLAWQVTRLLTNAPPRAKERWLNYYGPSKTLNAVSYYTVFDEGGVTPASISNKVVFVGADIVRTPAGQTATDRHGTPYQRWHEEKTPGVEIQATAFVNFINREWLNRLPGYIQYLLILGSGLLFGYGLTLVRPWVAARLAVAGFLVIIAVVMVVAWTTHTWFSWITIAFVQIPAAMVWSVIGTTRRLYDEKEALEESLATAMTHGSTPHANANAKAAPAGTGTGTDDSTVIGPVRRPGEPVPPAIPDHTMIKCIGKGAYGEVWLARDIIGTFHAVKVVYRNSFSSENPFLREFRGIQKFTPISRLHHGLVHILHVGRNEAGGYFYCIMEVGDDDKTGQDIDPENYSPRNLAKELDLRQQLPIGECIQLGINLAEALEFLHNQKLIHRDIKPSNIIYVRGTPKFADIGLVTEIASRERDVSFLGTEGFIAPEGPGSAAADVYSLGKLLYEAAMGRDRQQFPELPTGLDQFPNRDLLLQLNNILLKACENNVEERYQSAGEMLEDLRKIQG